jgi:SEC-C motif
MPAGYATDAEIVSTARMVQVLADAGYDPSSDREMQMGLTAFHAALLVCANASRPSPVHLAKKARAGRNDPCPCGSGKKYKKCCLDVDRPLSVADDRGLLIKFGPDVVPRLWSGDHDGEELCEDYERLADIMDRDPAFASIGFSPDEVSAFMLRATESEPALVEALKNDQDTRKPALDALGARFLREYSRDFGRSKIKDKCVEAARRATSNDEVRALATGICLSLIAEASDDPADDPLAVILFRKALFNAAWTARIVGRMMNRRPAEADELCRLIEANDPSTSEKLEAAANELSPSEMEILRANFDKLHRGVWDTIAAGEFPVPLPLATQLALFGRLYDVASAETPSRDAVTEAIAAASGDLIEEDYVQFAQMLDRWLHGNNEEGSSKIVEAVRMMRNLCAMRMIDDFAPTLFIRCLRDKLQIPFDDEERRFIEGASGAGGRLEFMTQYSAWLRMRGYPAMADRLVQRWKIDARSQDERPFVMREAG